MRSNLHAGLVELPIRYRGLAILRVLRESIALAVSRDDCLASRKTVVPEELIQRPLVLLSDQADLAHDKILIGIQSWGYRPEKVFHVVSLMQALDFVQTGEAVGALRGNFGRFGSRKVVKKSIPGMPTVDTGIVYRRQVRSPLVRNLLRIAREVFSRERARMTESGWRTLFWLAAKTTSYRAFTILGQESPSDFPNGHSRISCTCRRPPSRLR
jgi:DNA-binding transcriptional LysR family regulator